MFNKKITKLLADKLPALPLIIGEESLRHDLDDVILLALPQMRLGVIDDVNTSRAFGDKIFAAVKDRSECVHLTLADNIEANDVAIAHIRMKSAKCDALIAVGSGTINDLCKYAAHLDGKPYIIFPTAASMNGYLSANASITIKNHKTTLPAKLPAAVFCDFSVIASAPLRLSKSGLGDSLARPTAQADWLLSNLLLDTTYNSESFDLLSDIEPELFAHSGGIAKNDPKTIKTLMEVLLLSGIGMTMAGGSYPASQGEHMIAHSYNMLKKSVKNIKLLHGEEIGVTSLYMAVLQENFLKKSPILFSEKFDRNYLSEIYGNNLAEEFSKEFSTKQNRIREYCPTLNKNKWDSICEKLQKIMLPTKELEHIITKAELKTSIEALGWGENDFRTAATTARFTRSRFTFLDFE